MAFEIRNEDGKKLTTNELNLSASNFWDKIEIFSDERGEYVVSPTDDPGDSWQDTIGHVIEYPNVLSTLTGRHIMQSDWNDVRQSLLNIQMQDLEVFDEGSLFGHLHRVLIYLKPYYDLIDIWEGEGYTPVKIT